MLCGTGLSLPASASALDHPFLEPFGGATGPIFEKPAGLAVDQSTEDLLVIDREAGTVSRWNPDGTPAEFSALGTNVIDGSETPQGELSFGSAGEAQIAVDNSSGANDGNIYVTQSGAKVIDIFATDGSYLGQLSGYTEGPEAEGAAHLFEKSGEPCGVAVDPAGNVYVGDFGVGIHKFEPAADPPVNGDSVANFAFSNSCTLAAGSGATSGFVFPAHFVGSVAKLDSTTGVEEYELNAASTRTVSVDPATGHVYAAGKDEITEFDPSGASGATEVSATQLIDQAQGVAVNESTGNVYVTRAGSGKIEVFGPLPPAHVTGLKPSKGLTTGGNEVEIVGSNLADATKVEFGSTVIEAFLENTGTTIKVNAPAHPEAGVVDVRVTTLAGKSANSPSDDYTYELPTQTLAVAKGGGAGTVPLPEPGKLEAARRAAFSRGKVALKGTCRGMGACIGSLTLKAKIDGKNKVIGTASYDVKAGKSKTIDVRIINAQAKKRLREGESVNATVSGQGVQEGKLKLKAAGRRSGRAG
jgi:hypothetical protein